MREHGAHGVLRHSEAHRGQPAQLGAVVLELVAAATRKKAQQRRALKARAKHTLHTQGR